MNTAWIDGHLVFALMVIPALSVWLVGYVNYRIRIATRRRIFAARGGTR